MFSLGMGVKGGEFARGFFTPSLLVVAMRRVLHVGPCDTPGGMATVMHTLAEFPPEGWQADLLASHAPGGLWAKWRAYRRARQSLLRRIRSDEHRPDILHLHTAADLSWWRKRRFAKIAHKAGIPNVVHLHSGRFDTWLKKPTSFRSRQMVSNALKWNISFVGLSQDWKQKLSPFLGDVHYIDNPIHPLYVNQNLPRDNRELLLLGRDDSVKGHSFAIGVVSKLREIFPDLSLTMTGISSSPYAWVNALGWISEKEKVELLRRASVLLLPSKYEGQPMVVLEALASGLPVVAFQHLTSLSDEVHRAGSTVSDWCRILEKLLNNSVSVNFDLESHDAQYVSKQWGQFYEFLIDE